MSSYNNAKRVKDIPFKERWPTLVRFSKIGMTIGLIGFTILCLWLGVSGLVTGNLPGPFGNPPPLNYDQYAQQVAHQQQIYQANLPLLSLAFLFAGGYLGFRIVKPRLRRHKNRTEPEVKTEE